MDKRKRGDGVLRSMGMEPTQPLARGCGAPFACIFFAAEGIYTVQFIYCGKKANLMHHVGICGVLARASGDYAIVIRHNPDNGTSRIRLPSGAKKIVPIAYYAIGGVAMNPVEHPEGGGNHQHIGHTSTIRRDAPHGQKVGIIAARRTERLRGQAAATAFKQKIGPGTLSMG
ncbi:hypothetical protein ACHQM5_010039 [Ranunculus cassubicifolius]